MVSASADLDAFVLDSVSWGGNPIPPGSGTIHENGMEDWAKVTLRGITNWKEGFTLATAACPAVRSLFQYMTEALDDMRARLKNGDRPDGEGSKIDEAFKFWQGLQDQLQGKNSEEAVMTWLNRHGSDQKLWYTYDGEYRDEGIAEANLHLIKARRRPQ